MNTPNVISIYENCCRFLGHIYDGIDYTRSFCPNLFINVTVIDFGMICYLQCDVNNCVLKKKKCGVRNAFLFSCPNLKELSLHCKGCRSENHKGLLDLLNINFPAENLISFSYEQCCMTTELLCILSKCTNLKKLVLNYLWNNRKETASEIFNAISKSENLI